MLGVKLICVGKMKEKHYISALGEYEKRLKPLCAFDVEELPEQRLPDSPSPSEINSALQRESLHIIARLPKGAFVVAMCVEGIQLSSEELAVFINDCSSNGKSKIAFIIGGSHGLHESVKNQADLCLSMSKMTLPHHLARVMLAEQIYRAMMINGGTKYHK